MKEKADKLDWQDREDSSFVQRIAKIHPHQMILYGALVGISLVFLFLEIAFVVSSFHPKSRLVWVPSAFVASTALLISSSFAIAKTMKAYRNGDLERLSQFLLLTLALGIGYCGLQVFGWAELYQSNIKLSGTPAGSFLYLISGVHLAHILGGMGFLAMAFIIVRKKMQDPVDQLIYETSPYEIIRLRMLNIYWHVMDVIWVIIFTTFCLLL
ncbi:MAG: cytochrome c oxidase subunit 3 [Arenicella sp.]|jgi:cytochrome c oxidase subunit 3